MRESVIEKTLRLGVEDRGGLCLKFTSPGRRGAPDRIVAVPGYDVIFVELKAPDGILKRWQKEFHKDLKAAGRRVEVLWNLAQVERFLLML